MKKTLESFIDPQNIPKKYGGELDFEFGYSGPTIDPTLEKNFEWKTEKKEYPMGPLYWRKAEKDGLGVLELVAAGSEGGVERNVVVGVLHTSNTEEDLMNMEPDTQKLAINGKAKESSQTLQVPGQAATNGSPGSLGEKAEDSYAEAVVVQNGEVVPASRPALETFVTASSGGPLSPTYSGPVQDVPTPEEESQEATEKELANGIETPEEPGSIETSTETPATADAPAETPPVNNEATEPEKVESPTSPTNRMEELSEKMKSSFESLTLKGHKRDKSLERSEKSSVKSQKSMKDRIKDKFVT